MLDIAELNQTIYNKGKEDADLIVKCVQDQFADFEEQVTATAANGDRSNSFRLFLPEKYRKALAIFPATNEVLMLALVTLRNAYAPIEIDFIGGEVTYEETLTSQKYLPLRFKIPDTPHKNMEIGDEVKWEWK